MNQAFAWDSLTWQQVWLLGSLAAVALGFIGWQVAVFLAGAKAIARGDDGAGFSSTESALLASRLSNRKFKRKALSDADRPGFGRWSFRLFIFGLVSLLAFFGYAAALMD